MVSIGLQCGKTEADETPMPVFEFLLTLATFGVALPAGVLLVEVISSLGRSSRRHDVSASRRPPVTVVVPAHDEEAGIRNTLDSVNLQRRPDDRLLVVADNCSDRTAEIARKAGAEVVERHDPANRSKGYALRFAFDSLRESRPEIVVVVDADCRVEAGALDLLATAAAESGRPCQGSYLIEAPEGGDPFSSISQLAVLLKNHVRPLGLLRLGLPCQLGGSGMAFPWAIIERIQPDATSVVEDMQMGVDLARVGLAPRFVPDARITGVLPTSHSAAIEQRRRWEHGHLYTLIVEGPRLLVRGLMGGGRDCVALALDLMVPPLSFLAGATVLALVGAGLGALFGIGLLPLAVATFALASTTLAVLIGWWRFGRELVPGRALATIPLYAIKKLPLYLSFPARRERSWVRTARDKPESKNDIS